MEMVIWHWWVVAAVLLLIIEIFTTGFITASLALGCLLAALAAYTEMSLEWQLLAFSLGSLLGFFAARPLFLRYAHPKHKELKTNTEALVGKIGRVTETIDASRNMGRIYVEGDDWKAESQDEIVLPEGTRVEVLHVNSTILIVKPLN